MARQTVLERDANGTVTTWIDELEGKPVIVTADPTGRQHAVPVPQEYVDRNRFSVQALGDSAWIALKDYARNFVAQTYGNLGGGDSQYMREMNDAYYQDKAKRMFYEENYPIPAITGEIAATAPTALLGNRGGFLRQLGMSAGVGAAEEGMKYRPDESQLANTLYGGVAGGGMDLAGRLVGKLFNGAQAIVRRMDDPGKVPVNPAALNLESRGYKVTRPSDYMTDEDPGRGTLENFETNVAGSAFRNEFFEANDAYNQRRLQQRLWRGFGMPERGNFKEGNLLDVKRALNARQSEINAQIGDIQLDDSMVNLIQAMPEFKLGDKIGTFEDVSRYLREMEAYEKGAREALPEMPVLSGSEAVEFRSMLTEEASEAGAANTRRLGELIDSWDGMIEAQAPNNPELIDNMRNLREQWQLFFGINSRNVFGKDGNLNIGAFNQRMASRQGFGDNALYGDPELFKNPDIYDVVADGRALGQLRNLENYSRTGRRSISEELLDPQRAALTASQSAGLGLLMREGANARGPINQGIQGVMRDAPPYTGMAGRETRDLLLYPFVGSEDDRPQQ